MNNLLICQCAVIHKRPYFIIKIIFRLEFKNLQAMRLNEVKPYIIGILDKQDIEKALEELKKLVHKNSQVFNEIILLQDRRKRNEGRNRQGILSNEDYNLESNKIISGFTQLLDYILETDLEFTNTNTICKEDFDIESALEWLKGRLKALRFSQRNVVDEEFTLKIINLPKIEFSNNGIFRIALIEQNSITPYEKPTNFLEIHSKLIEGNFKDISTIETKCFYKDSRHEPDLIEMKLNAYNGNNLFNVQRIDTWFGESMKFENKHEEEYKDSTFSIILDDELMANRLRKAFSDICNYFGSQKEMY